MSIEKIDKIIIRSIGIIFLLGVSLCILLIVSAGWNEYKSHKKAKKNQTDIVKVDPETKEKTRFKLTRFEKIKGTEFLLASLFSNDKDDGMYLSKSTYGPAFNYIFFNKVNKNRSWLFDHNDYLIYHKNLVCKSTAECNSNKGLGYVFEYIGKDSDSDGVVTRYDEASAVYFDLKSEKKYPLIESVQRIVSVHNSKENEILVIYTDEGKTKFITYDIRNNVTSEPVDL